MSDPESGEQESEEEERRRESIIESEKDGEDVGGLAPRRLALAAAVPSGGFHFRHVTTSGVDSSP